MPSQIVIAHNDESFRESAATALRAAGYKDVAVAADNRSALLEIGRSTALLITRVAFAEGTRHGLALALMAKRTNPEIKVMFAARPEFRDDARSLGEFLPLPVNMTDLVSTVSRLMG